MMYRLTPLIFLVLFSCSLWPFRTGGDVDVVSMKSSRKALIGIGTIENRDSRFDPYANKNLIDMLSFEMSQRGYGTIKSDTSFAVERRRLEELKKLPSPGKTKDETADLLPERLRAVAGEIRPTGYTSIGDELLSPDEIRTLASRDNTTYFIQGAISRTEAGTLLEQAENFAVFLEVFNRNGDKVGAINFTVEGKSLQESPFLKTVCKRIARAFDEQIHSTSPYRTY
ncbi:MAG: lipoprotein [Leptospirales bacterium]|nr:lipoprotein [Leptospirales bacterium]